MQNLLQALDVLLTKPDPHHFYTKDTSISKILATLKMPGYKVRAKMWRTLSTPAIKR